LNFSYEGVSIYEIETAANNANLNAQTYQLTYKELLKIEMKVPVILAIKGANPHYIVVIRKRKGFCIFDPASDQPQYSDKIENFSGLMIVFKMKILLKKKRRSYDLFGFLIILTLFNLTNSFLTSCISFFLYLAISYALLNKSRNNLFVLIILFITLVSIKLIFIATSSPLQTLHNQYFHLH
jgi:ABC-type bacteriocin/lantibiotic exporter with double-glycine peptidase domain